MSGKPRCGDCRFYHGLRCVRLPPQVVALTDDSRTGHWPWVHEDSWCGEFEAKAGPDDE